MGFLWVSFTTTPCTKKKKICNYFQHTPLSICCSVDKSCPPLQPHEMQHARLPCPSLSPRVCSNSCPLSQWHHPTISSSVTSFSSSCLQSFPASGSFPMNGLFTSGQSTGASASASVLPMNIQDWFPLGLTDLISCSLRDSQESSTTPQFKSINSLVFSFLYSPTLTSIHDYWKKTYLSLDGPLAK